MNANIALVNQLYNAFQRREIPTILSLLSEEVEWGEPENPFNPSGGTKFGHSGFLEWVRIGREAEEILELTVYRFLTDLDSVAVLGHMKCLAKSTGKIYESDFVHFVVVQNGKVIKFQEFFDTFAAGEAFRNSELNHVSMLLSKN